MNSTAVSIGQMTDITSKEDSLAKQADAKARAFIRWDKVYNNDGKTIYHWRFRRFWWKHYHRTRHTSLLSSPTSMAIEHVTYGSDKKTLSKTRYIISFKGGKLAFFKRDGVTKPTVRRFSPLTRLFGSGVLYNHSIKDKCHDIKDFAGIKRNEKRLMRTFLDLARRNGVKICPYARKHAKTFDELVTYAYYPAALDLAQVGHKTYPFVGSGPILPFMRRPFKKALKVISGYDSRHLIKVLLKSKDTTRFIDALVLLRLLKGILSVDYLHSVIDSRATFDIVNSVRDANELRRARRFFLRFRDRPATLVRWLTEPNAWMLRDTIRMTEERFEANPAFQLPDTNSLVELHAEVTYAQRRALVGDRPIKHPEALTRLSLHRLEVDEYELVLPQTTGELADWGHKMNNCIGGYTNAIERGNTWILGLKRAGQIEYGIEMSPENYSFRQFKGNRNVDAPDELVKKTRDTIDMHVWAQKMLTTTDSQSLIGPT